MTRKLTGKAAVITGGASGIGKALARLCVDRGARVLIADIEQASLDACAAELGVSTHVTDVACPESMEKLAREALDRLGGVDLFFSNAGVASTGRIEDMTTADWQWMLGVNLYGFINGIRSFLPLLRASEDGGWLAVTASEAGFHPSPVIGGYTVSKYAVVGLAECLAAELRDAAENVGLTILCPGPVSTQLGSSQRNREDGGASGLVDHDLEKSGAGAALRWIGPEEVALGLLEAMGKGELYAFTHPEMAHQIHDRHRRIEDALRAAGTG